jgi:endonuclease YncB( thermonuclease family)
MRLDADELTLRSAAIDPDDNDVREVKYIRTHDGDTFWGYIVTLRAGSHTLGCENKIRVYGYSAAELAESEGPAMRDAFEQMLRLAGTIRIRLRGRSWDRYVADVFIDNQPFARKLGAKLAELRATHA